jgi:Mg/Co/Ni transporter MgtE
MRLAFAKTALSRLSWAALCLWAGVLCAAELSPEIKALETSLQTRLQDQIHTLFGRESRIVVNLRVQATRVQAPARRGPLRAKGDEMEMGYVPIPVSSDPEGDEKRPEARLKVQSVEVDLWVVENTDPEVVASVEALISRALSSYPTKIVRQTAKISTSSPEETRGPWWKQYLPMATTLTAALILGLALAVVAFMMRRSAHALAERMPSVGATGNAPQANINIENSQGGEGGSYNRLPVPTAGVAPAAATLRIQALKMRTEILEAMTPATEAAILRHVSSLLASPATVERAVVVFELLGKEAASEFFKKLPVSARHDIVQFMRQGEYSRPKLELMVEAAEDLKTRMLVDSLDTLKGGASEAVAERIVQLSDADLVETIASLEGDAIGRLYLYLEPGKIANLLNQLKAARPDRFQEALDMLPRMPELAKADHLDAAVIAELDMHLTRVQSDEQSPFLRTYQEIIESSGEDVAEQILKTMSSDQRLDGYLRENIITVKTIFRIDRALRKEMVESLSNKDIAALCLGFEPAENREIISLVAERRKPLIFEELESLKSRGGTQAEAATSRARGILVQKMKGLKEEGTLSISVKSLPSGSPPSASPPSAPPKMPPKGKKVA